MVRFRALWPALLVAVCVTVLAPTTLARASTANPSSTADPATVICPVSVVMHGSAYMTTIVVVNTGSAPLVDWAVRFTAPLPAYVHPYAENGTLTLVGTTGTLTPAWPPYTNTLAPGAAAIMRFSGVAFIATQRPTAFEVGGTPCQVAYYT
ncbi:MULTISPECIES: cellulose binding domain-containing protein [unclassified Micromonospora]|uniref:cellulose binding domain-containing protein n=1 Tax=unclassified Micromonospora TaxID=2617518 RepID=UPI001590AEE0|nr:cellulose binding domain-containing protein [Verrucosispora sp. NA02020]QKW14454.1 cellulose binding domain-containing protein [Verrucosispora sp. NA02020]